MIQKLHAEQAAERERDRLVMIEQQNKADANRREADKRKAVDSVANSALKPFAAKSNAPAPDLKYIQNMEEFKKTHDEAGDKVVVIDYTATWCPPCKHIGPIFAAMEKDHQNLVFRKVDVDAAKDVAQHAGIKAMPTFKFYKNGEEIETIQGANEAKL